MPSLSVEASVGAVGFWSMEGASQPSETGDTAGEPCGPHSTAAYNGHIYAYNSLLRALPGGGVFKEAKTRVFSGDPLSTRTVKRADLHSLIQPHPSGGLNLGSTPLKLMHS